jgi:hypothetical protein
MKLRKLGSNQTEISVGDNLVLFSYNTPVAAWVRGRGWLRTEQKFSKTTTKHINAWLGKNTGTVVPQAEIEGVCKTV